MTKISFFETEDWGKDYLKNQLKDFEVSFFKEKLSPNNVELIKQSQIISVFIDSEVNEEILNKLPDLKMIATRSTGFDQIDLNFCKEKNIVVCNVPCYGENTVAEHTFALILDLSRKIHNSIEKVKKEGFLVEKFTGFDLKGKNLGIVGTGRIGSHVARIARGFEMNVLAFDVKEDKKLANKLNFRYVPLEELLKNSDIITLHVPYNEKTHHLINSGNINLIKKGSYLINTARGGIIQTSALLEALNNGILAGAGLDVLEEECFIEEESRLFSKELPKKCDINILLQNHVLMEKENVIITPHNAFNSKEALERILNTTIENIIEFKKGKPINQVRI